MRNFRQDKDSCLCSQAGIFCIPPARALSVLLAFLAISLSLLSSGCAVRSKWRSVTIFVFDTFCDLRLFCQKDTWQTAQENIQQIFSEIDHLFSPESEDISSEIVLSLFERAREIHRNSEGCFDITVAPLTKLWGFWEGNHRVPSAEQVRSAIENVGMERIRMENSALYIPPGSGLDWGGIAKGLGVDLAAQSLKKKGINHGFINAGGDLVCWGDNPSRKPWKIGIKHPRKEGFLGALEITNTAAATSGDYQRYFIENGNRYHHIFDPRTGYPASGKQSVTVIGPEAIVCDALSTALFISSQPERIIAKYPDYGAVVMDEAGRISILGKNYPFQPSSEGLE